jgi:hypothetical protein
MDYELITHDERLKIKIGESTEVKAPERRVVLERILEVLPEKIKKIVIRGGGNNDRNL